jgi:hypothetical protein
MIRTILKFAVLAVVAGIVVIQFFGIDKANPPIVTGETVEAALTVPADITQIIGRSCGDCHTNNTRYPWYAYFQPSGWFLKDHIDEGRRELNFSVFNTYPIKKKAKKLEEICEQIESGEMPLPSYLWLHRDAVLSDSDGRVLCDWAKQEREKLLAAEKPS